MQISHLSLLAITLAGLAVAAPAPDPEMETSSLARGVDLAPRADFKWSCTHCHMKNGWGAGDMSVPTMWCRCDNGRGSWYENGIDLNRHMHNDGGYLRWGGTGYWDSCWDYDLNGVTLIYTATCDDGRRNPIRTSIDLNKYISNVYGYLEADNV